MNAGEYVGADGRTYMWFKHEGAWSLRSQWGGEWLCDVLKQGDWPAARSALDALIESEKEAEQWVEWTWAGGKCRANIDGSRIELWDFTNRTWADHSTSRTGQAYRKGLEIGQQQRDEAVRELKRHIEEAREWSEMRHAGFCTWPTAEAWDEIKAAAWAVKP